MKVWANFTAVTNPPDPRASCAPILSVTHQAPSPSLPLFSTTATTGSSWTRKNEHVLCKCTSLETTGRNQLTIPSARNSPNSVVSGPRRSLCIGLRNCCSLRSCAASNNWLICDSSSPPFHPSNCRCRRFPIYFLFCV